jgi:hypothetical protein
VAHKNETPLEELVKRFLACGENNATLMMTTRYATVDVTVK